MFHADSWRRLPRVDRRSYFFGVALLTCARLKLFPHLVGNRARDAGTG